MKKSIIIIVLVLVAILVGYLLSTPREIPSPQSENQIGAESTPFPDTPEAIDDTLKATKIDDLNGAFDGIDADINSL